MSPKAEPDKRNIIRINQSRETFKPFVNGSEDEFDPVELKLLPVLAQESLRL